ncbi:MAG: flagellar basal body rod C-terminal domain-containing protein [Planctomycetota bacterium]
MSLSSMSSVSGIKAAFGIMGVSSHNTANLNTNGFKKQTSNLHEEINGGVTHTVGRNTEPGSMYPDADGNMVESSNVDVAEEAGSRIGAKNLLTANLKALKVADEMQKSLIDILL